MANNNSGILRPRRGKRATAITKGIVLKKGEIFFEVPDTGVGTGAGKIVMGDGESAYEDLPYFDDGTNAAIEPILITKADYDILSPEEKANHRYIITDYPDGEIIDLSTSTVTGNPLSFTTDSEQVARSCEITFKPIQAGSGDPSPSNVREISGYDEIGLIGCGKNLIDVESGTWNITNNKASKYKDDLRLRCTYFIRIKANSNYVIKLIYSVSKQVQFLIMKFKDGVYIGNLSSWTNINSNSGYVFNVTDEYANEILIVFKYSDDSNILLSDISNVQLELGSTATAYEPYNPITDISQSLPETVYGGTLNVETGELVVDKGIVDLGDLEYSYNSEISSMIADTPSNFADRVSGGLVVSCSIFTPFRGDWRNMPNNSIIVNSAGFSGSNKIGIKETSYTDASAFKTAMSGQKLVCPLATPYTIYLTPAQVKLLKGANVVTTNGTTINLTYRNGEVAALSDLSPIGDSINSLSRLVSPYTDFLSNNPLNKNGIFTGRYLGVITAGNIDTFITDHGIAEGKFDGLGLGDYFTIQDGYHNTDWMIAGFDQFANKGGNYVPGHHITVIPRTYLNKPQVSTDNLCLMNSTNTTGVSKNPDNPLYATTQGAETAGYQAYYGSDMCQIYLPAMVDKLQQVLGSHLLKTDYLLSNTMDLSGTSRNGLIGFPTNWKLANNERVAYAILPTEIEIYGSIVWSHGTYDIGINNKILPVFNFITYNIYSRAHFWLRSVVSSTNFAVAGNIGNSNSGSSSYRFCVRPLINIG